MSDTPKRILVVDDEPDMRQGLRHNLELEGFDVAEAGDGEAGLEAVVAQRPALVVLDIMMPTMDGLAMLRELRDRGDGTPVILLTAKGQDQEVVEGLEQGADDYITKPFGLDEVMARIRAVLRRAPEGAEPLATDRPVWRFQNLTIDFRRFTVDNGQKEQQLSRYEAEILRMLVDRRGSVVSRKDLLTEVWGYSHLPTTRTVDNHIARLRKKVEINPDRPVHVVTVHGLGYRFDADPDAADGGSES